MVLMLYQGSVSDRFYRALYDTLLSPHLQKAYKNGLYLNLLYRAMKVRAVYIIVSLSNVA